MIMFDRTTIGNYQDALSKEWLVTNGLGGYSSSTIIGMNTRKYHGLFITPTNPPWERKLLLSKFEEEIFIDRKKFQLSTNEYPGVTHPNGYVHMQQFLLDPFPTFFYSLPELSTKKTVFMLHQKNAMVANYKILNHTKKPAKIQIFPLINSRGVHALTKRESIDWHFSQEKHGEKVKVVASYPNAPKLSLKSDLMHYSESELGEEERWFKNMQYPCERERGYPYLEDHYNPGFFELDLREGMNEFNLVAGAGLELGGNLHHLFLDNPTKFKEVYNNSVERLKGLTRFNSSATKNEGLRYLAWAADSFVVDGSEKAIIAGYHWFSTWGRDSLLSLPGLTLVTGRFEIAKEILLALSKRFKNGLIPNTFSGVTAEYNSIDSSLLFFYALYKYLVYTDDTSIIDELWDTLTRIINGYVRGVDGLIKMDEDGMIWGAGGLTWMDAKLDGKSVTPREGEAVEVNSLWYNALKLMEIIEQKTGKEFEHHGLAERVERNFAAKFWNQEKNCLHDIIDADRKDPRVRPNQIFAVFLPFGTLDLKKSKGVVSIVKERLLTPYGLRSLEKGDPSYRGVYRGNVMERDSAYHQGTVWSWLIGPFITSYLKVGEHPSDKDRAEDFLSKLMVEHLKSAGLGSISEIFDGDEPHAPRGCISQAWSVAEVLRAYVEDVMGKRPKYENKYW
jgi:predicted glycogen debranching enzyme